MSGPILGWLGQQPELYRQVEEFRSATKLTDLDILRQALYIQIWSAFELSLRSMTTSYLAECCKRGADFDSLNKAKIIERNLYHSGVALQQVFDNRSHLDLRFYEIAKNVGTSIPNSPNVSLNTAAFTLFARGPSVSGIEDALRRIGIINFDWDVLGRVVGIQKIFGTRGHRETVSQLKLFLTEAEKIRNHIVHRGEKIQPVNETDLRQHSTKFEAVAFGIADHLLANLNAL